jgi:3-carboxy-cis,cis-muconate cycloisomerase
VKPAISHDDSGAAPAEQRAHALFSRPARLQRMLDFEVALARAEARCGVIPSPAAEVIASCCRAELLDDESLDREACLAGNFAIPLVRQLTQLVAGRDREAAGYVHWGATSQDAIDTGTVLEMRNALNAMEADLRQICGVLAELTARHRATILPGRTWLQHAVPVTFGLKTAGWLDACLRHIERLAGLRDRVLRLQFGGAAGTLASLGEQGDAVAAALAEELSLALPLVPWHTHRDRMAEAGAWCGLVTGTLGKVARDLSLSMQTEVGELLEAGEEGRGGSSTMPQKRNPVAAADVLAAAIRMPGLVSTLLAAMVQEHERALGGWQAEWETLPEIFTLSAHALTRMTEALSEVEVHPEAMAANLDATGGMLLAEAASMTLARSLGRAEAHLLVEAASRQAIAKKKSLREILEESPATACAFSAAQLDSIFDPSRYLGTTQAMIDRVLAHYRELS